MNTENELNIGNIEPSYKNNDNSSDDKLYITIINWTLFTLLWFLVIFTIFIHKHLIIQIIFIIIFYSLLFISEITSRTSKFLQNILTKEKFIEKMKIYYNSRPMLIMDFKDRYIKSNNEQHLSKIFKYFSHRDLSSELKLNSFSGNYYTKLYIKTQIDFADPFTALDYHRLIEAYNVLKESINPSNVDIEQNNNEENKDEENKKALELLIKNLTNCKNEEFLLLNLYDGNENANNAQNNNANVNDNKLNFINFNLMLIFIIFTLGEVYKIIFRRKTLNVYYTINKLVSSRINLNNKNFETFFPSPPSIFIDGNQVFKMKFIDTYTYPANRDYMPDEEEIPRAKLFMNDVPENGIKDIKRILEITNKYKNSNKRLNQRYYTINNRNMIILSENARFRFNEGENNNAKSHHIVIDYKNNKRTSSRSIRGISGSVSESVSVYSLGRQEVAPPPAFQ